MFKKKPQIKPLSPLRSSDRRKLADQIISDYHIPIPSPPTSEPSTTTDTPPDPPHQQQQTLTSLRLSLIPETTLSARFTTHSGPNLTPVSGTIYVGSHSSTFSSHTEERILWLSYGKSTRLYPTVYTLWQNPGLVPLLHTQDFVVEKLQTGADLMTPGLVGGPPWPEGAKEGSVVAVAAMGRRSVPVWVGVCKVDVSGLGKVQGLKGVAVEGVHWVGDEVWAWSQNSVGGRGPPEELEGWVGGLENGMEQLDLEDGDEEEEGEQEDGGVAVDEGLQNGHAEATNGTTEGDEEVEAEPEHEPTTAEVDDAFHQAFLYSIYDAKKSGGPPPNYGIDFPIQPSFLISNMIQPHLRVQNQHYTIKKTSWKNVKKFIKHLDKQVLVKSKDRNGGETVILDVDFKDQQIANFTPYKLPKPKSTTEITSSSDPTSSSSDQSINQRLSLITIYRSTPKLVPDLLPSKTTFYTATQINSFIKTYITNHPSLTDASKTSSKRFISLDPFLANTILHHTSPTFSSIDTQALATGEIARDALSKRILDDPSLLTPFWLLLRNDEITSFDPANPDTILTNHKHKPKAFPAPKVLLTLEKRTGNKTITKISGLESFGINPSLLGPELQKKCAGSASVAQLVGGKPGMLEVSVQGDQRDVVTKEVGRRGVESRWVEVVDRTKKKKK